MFYLLGFVDIIFRHQYGFTARCELSQIPWRWTICFANLYFTQTLLAADAESVLKRNAQIIQEWTAALRARHSGDNSPQNNARIEQCSTAMQSSIQLLARLADSQGRPVNLKHEDVKAGLPPSLYSLRVQPVLDAGGGVPAQQIPQAGAAAAAPPMQQQHQQHAQRMPQGYSVAQQGQMQQAHPAYAQRAAPPAGYAQAAPQGYAPSQQQQQQHPGMQQQQQRWG